MIAIIDYGVGNIKAFANIYKSLGMVAKIAQTSKDLIGATKLILPGVGHFDYAMERFAHSGMMEPSNELVMEKKIPVVGICVGMQMLAKSSEEGLLPGLGWIDGTVKKFDAASLKQSTRLPHMGWNDVAPVKENPLFYNLEEKARFYFLHSYYFQCNDQDDSIAVADYGVQFTCVVNHDHIYGVQFHPEKSHHFGIQLLKNFSNI
jgi:glutamine amidotransferase